MKARLLSFIRRSRIQFDDSRPPRYWAELIVGKSRLGPRDNSVNVSAILVFFLLGVCVPYLWVRSLGHMARPRPTPVIMTPVIRTPTPMVLLPTPSPTPSPTPTPTVTVTPTPVLYGALYSYYYPYCYCHSYARAVWCSVLVLLPPVGWA